MNGLQPGPSRYRVLARRYAGLLLLLGTVAAGAYVGQRYHAVIDATAAGRHTLAAASLEVVAKLMGPVTVTAYLPADHADADRVRLLIDRYRRRYRDFSLNFVDPADMPDLARVQGLRDGELLLRYGQREARVNRPTEPAVTNALVKLLRDEQSWLAVVTGHGERSAVRGANHDLSEWSALLTQRGFEVRELALADVAAVPDNTAVAIIASPRVDYLPAELAALQAFIREGGNLLWLLEPGSLAGLTPLADTIGFRVIPGTLIDPLTIRYNIDNAAIATAASYGKHALVANFNLITAFPYAAGLQARPVADGWTSTSLLWTDARAWAEAGATDTGNVALDPETDVPGPHDLAIAFSRPRKAGGEQRVVVYGDGDFLANQYLGTGGNRELGLRAIEWLAEDDALIDIAVRRNIDTYFELRRWQIAVFGFGFLFVLPLLCVVNGVRIWRGRERA